MQNTQSYKRDKYCGAMALLTMILASSTQAAVLVQEVKQVKDKAKKDSTQELKELVVSALRTPQVASTVTSTVTRLDPEALDKQGIYQLRDALNQSPGVISTATSGQTGAPTSLFIRGTNTMHTQVVVDGMRLGDSNAIPNNILSSFRTYDLGKLEVLRGPQGAIYGGESAGGVLWMETKKGSGSAAGETFVEAGSFDSFATHTTYQGETPWLNYFVSGGYEHTDNDGKNLNFDQYNVAMSAQAKVNEVWSVGTTFRGADSYYQNRNSPEADNQTSLVTLYANGRISDRWTARFHLGHYDNEYETTRNQVKSTTDSAMTTLSTDHEIQVNDRIKWLVGAFATYNQYDNGVFDQNGERYGMHSAVEWEMIDHLIGSASIRWEDYDYWGDAVTWRVGSSYDLEATQTVFRAGVGSSFRAPSYLEVYGNSGWWINPNPNIKEETSLGWDVSVEQKLMASHKVVATWFRNEFQDRIIYSTDPITWMGQYENQEGKSVTEGLETALVGGWLDNRVNYSLAWTYLYQSLSDHPKNAVNAALNWNVTDKLTLGVGATHYSARSWGNDSNYKELDGYVVTRVNASYQLTDRIRLHGRIENLLDEDYMLSDIYGTRVPGAGVGAYAGVSMTW